MRAYLGIDIGTYESKGVLVDADGQVLAMAARPHRMLVPEPGFAEHRPVEDWWGDFTHLSRRLIAESGIDARDIRAVGTSAIGPCMLPLDEAGAPLMNAVLYSVDTRAHREIAELTDRLGADRILTRCGNALTTQSVGPKILWLRRNRPDIFARTRRIVTSTSYLVLRLTGACPIDHYTASTWGPHYLIDERCWSDELAADIAPSALLPDLAWPTDIAGTVTAAAAAETGLAPGTPVIVGTVDAAAEALSVGVREDGDMMMMVGSSIFIIEITKERVSDRRLWSAPWLFPHQNAAMAMLATAGTLTHWFRDTIGRDLDPATALPMLAQEAASSPPGANGLVCLPYFAGIQTPWHDPAARGAFVGLDLSHGRADLIRALLEGMALATRQIVETFAEVGQAPRRVFAVGGGTRNAPWSQAMSDAGGYTQILRARTTGASYGDAFLAALAIGDVAPDAIERWNTIAGEVRPDPALRGLYDTRYATFLALQEATRRLHGSSVTGKTGAAD